MIGVNGSFAANQRAPPLAIDSDGMNALLMKGRKAGISARLLAPAGVLASSPNATVSHVSVIVSMMNTPVAATHSIGLAVDRNPISMATATTRIPLISVLVVLPMT